MIGAVDAASPVCRPSARSSRDAGIRGGRVL